MKKINRDLISDNINYSYGITQNEDYHCFFSSRNNSSNPYKSKKIGDSSFFIMERFVEERKLRFGFGSGLCILYEVYFVDHYNKKIIKHFNQSITIKGKKLNDIQNDFIKKNELRLKNKALDVFYTEVDKQEKIVVIEETLGNFD